MELKALHSPTCCVDDEGSLYVAFYAGRRECINQRVFVYKREKGKKLTLFTKLPLGTGNPALFTFQNHVYCAYSVFTQPFVKSVFPLWQTAYTSIINITDKSSKPTIVSTYCCPRCNPYKMKGGGLLLPCYDEGIERGMVFSISATSQMQRAVCLSDFPVIQPTLVDFEDKLHVLFRNFKRGFSDQSERVAMASSIVISQAQKKLMFTDVVKTNIPNHNESIIGINDDGGNALVVYNAKQGRTNLTLGLLTSEDGVLSADPIIELNEEAKGSYPNHCYNSKGQLIVCFTSYETGINAGSRICIATISKNYKKALSRTYIDGDMLSNED
jgi:hypothetical protein